MHLQGREAQNFSLMITDDNVNELSKHNKWNKLLPHNQVGTIEMLQKGRKGSLVYFINETGARNKGWFDSLVDIFKRLAWRVFNFSEKGQDWPELPLIPLFEVRLW